MCGNDLALPDQFQQFRSGDDVIILAELPDKFTVAFDARIVPVDAVAVLVPVQQGPGMYEADKKTIPAADAVRNE